MTDSASDFVATIRTIPALALAVDEATQAWGADIPTSLLFSQVAKALIQDFHALSQEELSCVFNCVEDGMNSHDEALIAYLATGFLESLYSAASNDASLLQELGAYLGDRSRRYLTAWNQWQGH